MAAADPPQFGRTAVERQEVVLEKLDTVEPNRCRGFELLRQGPGERDGCYRAREWERRWTHDPLRSDIEEHGFGFAVRAALQPDVESPVVLALG